MATLKDYFRTEELVCPHVYKRFGERSLDFIDEKMKETLLVIREKLNRPMYPLEGLGPVR